MELEVTRRELRFREPLRTAYGTLERRELVSIRLRADDGTVGVGEAAPLEPYDGVSVEAVHEQIEACRELLAQGEGTSRAQLLAACAERCALAAALSGVDIALWDLEARRRHRRVVGLLDAGALAEVPVNATIDASAPAAAAARAAEAVDAGFSCLKVKAGVDGDEARVAAVRAAAGRQAQIRLDANGAWSVAEAVDALRGLARGGIELCEEPVHGVVALREVRGALNGRVAISMDETAALPGAIGAGAVDAVCLKVARCGGISGVLAAARTARAAGSDVYLASSFDGPVGIAAALHAAAALRVKRHCGLATLALFADCADPFPVQQGSIALPEGPGLGVSA